MNPYTHLRTLLDDESKHDELRVALYVHTSQEQSNGPVPDYTTSLDALIPLWPEGWMWSLQSTNICIGQGGFEDGEKIGHGPTPALAMLDCLLQVLEYQYNRKEELK